MHLSLLLLLACGFIASTHAGDITADQIKNVYKTLDSNNYDKRVRPNQGGPPVDVVVTMYVMAMDDVTNKPDQYQIAVYFRQSWNDSRLAFTGDGPVIGNIDLLDKIWTPDTFFANAIDGYFHNIMKPNWFVRINTTGEVQISSRITQTFSCPSVRNDYNLEGLRCTMDMESYAFSAKDIVYRWKNEKALAIDTHLSLPNLRVVGEEQRTQMIKLSSGDYSRLIALIKLEPVFPAHFLYMKRMLPIILTTILSFAPFFLSASKVRSLVTISSSLVTAVLVVLVNNSLPVVRMPYSESLFGFGGMTFFDYYGLTCIVFTIISVVHEIRSHNKPEKEAEATQQLLRDKITSKAVPLMFAFVTVASGIYMFLINSYKV